MADSKPEWMTGDAEKWADAKITECIKLEAEIERLTSALRDIERSRNSIMSATVGYELQEIARTTLQGVTGKSPDIPPDDLRAAVERALQVLRDVALERQKLGPLATHAQDAAWKLSSAFGPDGEENQCGEMPNRHGGPLEDTPAAEQTGALPQAPSEEGRIDVAGADSRGASDGWQPIETALRSAFPHFQNGEPITAVAINGIGLEWTEMVMTWAPVEEAIEFIDQDGNTRTIAYERGDDTDGWVMPEDADWQVQPLPPSNAGGS